MVAVFGNHFDQSPDQIVPALELHLHPAPALPHPVPVGNEFVEHHHQPHRQKQHQPDQNIAAVHNHLLPPARRESNSKGQPRSGVLRNATQPPKTIAAAF